MGAVGARCGGRLTSGTGPVSWFDWHWSWRSLGKAQSDGGNGPLSRLSCRRTMRRRRHRPSSLGIVLVSELLSRRKVDVRPCVVVGGWVSGWAGG